MTADGWGSIVTILEEDASYDSETASITVTGTGVDSYSHITVGFYKSVTDCYSITVNLTGVNDYPDDMWVGVQSHLDGDYIVISGTTDYKWTYTTPYTGTAWFFLRGTTETYVADTESCNLTVNSVTVNYCSPAFSADNVNPLANEVVTFTNASLGSDLTYLWSISGTEGTDWEYSGTSTENSENPEVVFLTDGDYDVSLTVYVSEVECDTETKSSYISVAPVVTAQNMRKSFCVVVNNTSYRNVR